MIRRALSALLALCFVGAAVAQTYQPGRAPGFRPGFQFLVAGGGAPATYSAWSTTDKGPTTTLSNNNRRATLGSGNNITRGTQAAPAGWAHLELTLIADGGNANAGLYSPAIANDAGSAVADANSVVVLKNGTVYIGGTAVTGNMPALTAGDTFGIDYNKTTGEVVPIGKNGAVAQNGTGSLAAGTINFPGCGNFSGNQTWDLNTGNSPFLVNINNRPAWN